MTKIIKNELKAEEKQEISAIKQHLEPLYGKMKFQKRFKSEIYSSYYFNTKTARITVSIQPKLSKEDVQC
jgi:hypothetical protein